MKKSISFPELGKVNKKSLKFIKFFLSNWIRYLPFFFKNAPMNKWYDYFGSSYRVSFDCARAKMALENESDIWNKNALRSKFLHAFD